MFPAGHNSLRLLGTLKNMVSKFATDHPKSWHQHLGYILWALRECPNETRGVALWMMIFGKVPRGPLAVLKENWTGQRDVPLSFGQSTLCLKKNKTPNSCP